MSLWDFLLGDIFMGTFLISPLFSRGISQVFPKVKHWGGCAGGSGGDVRLETQLSCPRDPLYLPQFPQDRVQREIPQGKENNPLWCDPPNTLKQLSAPKSGFGPHLYRAFISR